MPAIFEQYPATTMRPGDLYWYNDCHGSRGGVSHSPDMVFAAPVFHRGRLVAFSQTWGHFWDIGGLRAGSISPDATEIFHEGIIVPPIRIYRSGSTTRPSASCPQLALSRHPARDIRAVLAGCRLRERRVQELFALLGPATVRRRGPSSSSSAGRPSRRPCARACLTAPGRARTPWTATDVGHPFHVRMSLTKHGDRIDRHPASDDQASARSTSSCTTACPS
jgi:N-methylhydantoinase B